MKPSKRPCYKTFSGCKTCPGTNDDDSGLTCDVCASPNAEFDGEGCVCIGEYGTLTRSQYFSARKKAKKDHKDRKGTKHVGRYIKIRKHAGKYGKRCVRITTSSPMRGYASIRKMRREKGQVWHILCRTRVYFFV